MFRQQISMFLLITILLIPAVAPPSAQGQFPRACINRSSLKNRECCPVPQGFTAPCGSDGNRGKCHEFTVRRWNVTYSHFKEFQKEDDRSLWPNPLYTRVCKCNANFGGYDCGDCEFGYHGTNCDQKTILKRKNFQTMSDEEKDRYMRYVNMSRFAISDYMVTTAAYDEIRNESDHGGDPTGLFSNITVHNLFVWMHYYSTRYTFFPDERGTQSGIDVAHGGQGILTWHRLYLLFFDRSLQKMTHDKSFTVPYWKWTENKETCTICTEKHLGVTNVTTGRVTGKYFTSWSVICTEEQTRGLTRMCNSSDEKSWLVRLNSKEKKGLEDRGFATTFPTLEDVNFALKFETFDLPPHSAETSCSFRNILEGFASSKTGYRLPNVHTLHNQVHISMGGDMGDVPSAANDPIFYLHHSFIDQIFEKWLQTYKQNATILSPYDAPLGHNKGGVIIPMFPLYTHEQMFKRSQEFGYSYEGIDEIGPPPGEGFPPGFCPVSGSNSTPPCPSPSANLQSNYAIIIGLSVAVPLLFFLLVAVLAYFYKSRRPVSSPVTTYAEYRELQPSELQTSEQSTAGTTGDHDDGDNDQMEDPLLPIPM